jgi:hypothetical protein
MISSSYARSLLAPIYGSAFLVACIGLSGCGPDLNSPGSTNVSGTWFADGPAAGMTNIAMILVQTPDGHVTGTFTAIGTQGEQVCPASGPCNISSTINGVNTVLQVNLELKDAGTFTGQVITSTQLRGTMTRTSNSLVVFIRSSTP